MTSVNTAFMAETKFEDLCRLCGSKTDIMAVHIFDNEWTFNELCKKIYSCLQIQIYHHDEMPKLLCENCLVKLEMFWEFKDRSIRTEQVLMELYSKLKHSGSHQCVVSLDVNGMMLQVSSNLVVPQSMSTDIDISQLGRRDNNDPHDYTVILNHDDFPRDLQNAQLENLELNGHNLTDVSGHDLSAHNMDNSHDDLVIVVPSSQNDQRLNERFTDENLTLMQQQLLSEEFKMHQDLQANAGTIYSDSVKQVSQGKNGSKQIDSLDYSCQKSNIKIDSHFSDNSLGVEVDTQFDRIITYSSDSQMDQIHQPEESDSNPNLLVDQDTSNMETFLGNTDQPRENFSGFSATFDSSTVLQDDQSNFFKFDSENSTFHPDCDREAIKTEYLAYKDEISLDSVGDGLRNDDSLSLDRPLHGMTNTESQIILSETKDITNGLSGNPNKNNGKSSSKAGPKVCTVCGKSYKSNYKLAEHMTKHTGERPYKCGSCDKAFRSKIGLAQHEAKHTGQYELSCPTCGKGFQCKSYLMVHQRVHSDVKPFPCSTCGLNFKTKQSLLDHTNRHLGVKPFSCSICNRGFITKSLCIAHERTHAGVDNRKYSCKICQKRFVSKSYLQTHSRIHTGEKSFICEVCGKGFLTGVDLKIHLTMHTGEKSFVCEMCGKAFARRDALKCHRRLHTGERPYRCDVCGRTFTQFTPMANHRKHHTGEKPFTCETCGKTFVSRSTMVSHQKKHHKTENLSNKNPNPNVKVKVKDEMQVEVPSNAS
ncbi:zinc finger protein ZFP2-like isoform X2 [Anthonomus grandis grandis]|uniref:zinc finger protein ZFP2-like isoform X2 n=1 Tax=Anthonomus grandis grandis TaxID=2921223 RepID=UPI002166830B|nr:zinc finger protein ZFP2-like isoform X2 [Anthonomus grandis grandis]